MKFVSPPAETATSLAGQIVALVADGPLQIAILAAVALFLCALMLRAARRRGPCRAARACRWSRDKRGTPTLVRWQCATCGVDAFTATGKRPRECKRNLREAQL